MRATPATRFFWPVFVGAPGSRGVVLLLSMEAPRRALLLVGIPPGQGAVAANLPVLE